MIKIKIIVLLANDNSGKTTTIKKVIGDLIAKGAKLPVINGKCRFKGMRSSDNLETFLKEGDVSIQLSYLQKEIGITSVGDSISIIRNKIEFFYENGCDCCLFAAHLKGSSYDYVQSLEQDKANEVVRVYKISINSQNKNDHKYKILCDLSDTLAVSEIISHINNF